MSTILQLAPQNVWKHFYELTRIPRPSGHVEQVTEFLVNFGKSLNLESFVDEAGNVIIRKPATPGMENRKGVILQAHMDMVPQKNNDTVHDFTRDPIETYVDGDWLKAKGTTLGADNGLGVAAIMAVLEATDLKHGPLEALITKDEETGMYGAFGLKPGILNGQILLNLDSEEEGELYIGCAGGLDITATLKYKEEEACPGMVACRITLKGLRGGHSGLEINEGRANANKLLIRVVHDLVVEFGCTLASFEGGNMRNAIPREAHAVLLTCPDDLEGIKAYVDEYKEIFVDEFTPIESDIQLYMEEVPVPATVVPEETEWRDAHDSHRARHRGDLVQPGHCHHRRRQGGLPHPRPQLVRHDEGLPGRQPGGLLLHGRHEGGVQRCLLRLATQCRFAHPARHGGFLRTAVRHEARRQGHPRRIGVRHHRGHLCRAGHGFLRSHLAFAPLARRARLHPFGC